MHAAVARPRAEVSGKGAARWAGGHPWIYRSDVVERPDAPAGTVTVEDPRGRVLGQALWSPTSEISLRMLTRDDRPIDAAFWSERVAAAVTRRRGVDATAWRAVHGEADGVPSLIADVLDRVVVVQLLSAGLEAYREEIVAALREHLDPAGILARNDVAVRRHEALPEAVELLWGEVPERIEVREGRVRYIAAPWSGQKTGAFLDQRENRLLAGELARGRVLDAFSFHGSFALHMAGSAERVEAVDASAEALERALENASLNGIRNLTTVESNAFDFLRERESSGARYDVVVLDPPAFAKHRSSVRAALRGYKEINLRGLRLLEPGGHLLTFSCSYHISEPDFAGMLERAAADAGRPVRWVRWLGQSADHPRVVQIPETGYLKGALLQALE
ncbi:MAG TPA: class I SAM-dependent rRNA methyltransferase [Longimicrobiales bacterium]|nr:class I SAM-dependent rRNA methyltransferase [Longimicrobiales bacterium]